MKMVKAADLLLERNKRDELYEENVALHAQLALLQKSHAALVEHHREDHHGAAWEENGGVFISGLHGIAMGFRDLAKMFPASKDSYESCADTLDAFVNGYEGIGSDE